MNMFFSYGNGLFLTCMSYSIHINTFLLSVFEITGEKYEVVQYIQNLHMHMYLQRSDVYMPTYISARAKFKPWETIFYSTVVNWQMRGNLDTVSNIILAMNCFLVASHCVKLKSCWREVTRTHNKWLCRLIQ